MGLLVKICGINSVEAADAAVRAGADMAGLAFHPRSPRNLEPDQAAMLAARMRGRLRLVVLLSDPSDEALTRATGAVRPDFIQLHGSEAPDRVGSVRAQFGIPIIKVVSVAEASDLDRAVTYAGCADMFLFDAKAPAGSVREGGHGNAFDWQMLRGRTFTRPWLLAGGLNPHNVAAAIRSSQAHGVDVSSGVESASGRKDVDLIAQFVTNARSAELAIETRS